MISSASARVRPPSASAVSARPSRWMAPVTTSPRPRARTAAARGGGGVSSPTAASPTAAPTAAPTSGKKTAPRATSAAPSFTSLPSGRRVRNATAPAAPRSCAAALPTGIGHSGVRERRHVGQHGERRVEEGKGERSPASLAEPKAEGEERLEPEGGEHERVPGLRREGRGDHRVAGVRREPGGDEGGGARDEAVEEDDEPTGGRAERDSDEERDLEPADGGEHGEGIAGVGVVHRERAPHDGDLARDPVGVDPRARAADELRIGRQEHGA